MSDAKRWCLNSLHSPKSRWAQILAAVQQVLIVVSRGAMYSQSPGAPSDIPDLPALLTTEMCCYIVHLTYALMGSLDRPLTAALPSFNCCTHWGGHWRYPLQPSYFRFKNLLLEQFSDWFCNASTNIIYFVPFFLSGGFLYVDRWPQQWAILVSTITNFTLKILV